VRTTALAAAVGLLLTLAACTTDAGASPDDGGTGAAASDPSEGSRSGDPASPDPTPVPTVTGRSGGQSGGDGSESLPEPSAAPSGLAGLLPTDLPSAARLDSLPPDVDALDGLADGFPTGILFSPEGADTVASSATSDGARAQLALDASVDGACSDQLADLRAWYTAGGFAETADTRETTDRADLAFTRDDGHVTVAAETASGRCRLTQFAVLTAGTGS
jgi:hypothetical protein